MACGIYGIVNTANGKWYVGQSVDIERRKATHFYDLKACKHYNECLQRAYQKYGKNAFEFRIIEEDMPEAILDARERSWIEFYRSNDRSYGYNLDSGGKTYKRHSKETLKKMSLSHLGIKYGPHSEKWKIEASMIRKNNQLQMDKIRQLGLASKGRKHSLEARMKISKALTGKKRCPHSEEAKIKMSEARKKYYSKNKE